MRRHNFDYRKYGGRLDPDENIFFGPITIRELKRSMELAEQLAERKKNMKLTTAPKEEDSENQLNRTFDLEDAEKLNTTFEVQSDREDNETLIALEPLKDISNMTVASAFDKLNIADSPRDTSIRKYNTARKKNPLDDTVMSVIRDNLQTPLIDKFPKKCTAHIGIEKGHVSSSSEVNSGVTKTRNNLTSLSSIKAGVRKNSRTPLLEKLSKKCPTKNEFKNVTFPRSSQIDDNATKRNNDSTSPSTPVTKLSDTFVTDLTEKNCLIDSPLNNDIIAAASSKNQSTPDVFKRKRNDVWKNDSSVKKSGGAGYFKSRLPLTKQSHYFKSPVADYIYRGLQVQSMSKLRHSHCVVSEEITKSKSDNKSNKPCKIPVSVNATAKRKLNLVEVKTTAKK